MSEQDDRRATGFDFGRNWERFSLRLLDEDRLSQAEHSLEDLLGPEGLRGRRFLDVGAGTGMFSIAASRAGASEVVGMDVDERCVSVARRNLERFGAPGAAAFKTGSILDRAFLQRQGRFDVVYAWGSLHHTGALWEAVERAAGCVAPRGRLVLAIYNRHFTSPAWRLIKRLYQALPRAGRGLMAGIFAGVIFVAKLLVTRRNPLRKRRGMSFLVDVVDWVGGYPYEYASPDEVESHLRRLGFVRERFMPARVPTGCNEYVYRAPKSVSCTT